MNDTHATAEWFRMHMRQVHLDFHMPEFPREAICNFDAKRMIDHIHRGRINMVALFAKCHFGNAFYNTAVGHKHAGLKEDYLAETSAECRKHGIATLAYYSLCCDAWAYYNRPHWRQVDEENQDKPVSGVWHPVCINSPYREELVLPQCAEIAANYDVDGVFIDIAVSHGCFCRYCRSKFRRLHGVEIEAASQSERASFWFMSSARFLRELRITLDRHNPKLHVVTNSAGHLLVPRSFHLASDIGVWESQPRHNYLSHSFAARAVRTMPRPVQVMSVRFYQGWGDLSLKPTAQMTTEFAAMIGNGVAATSGDQVQVDGSLQPPVYDMFNRAFKLVQDHEDILRNAKSIPDTALLAPVRHPDFESPGAEGDAMKGAHKALVESHVQFDILNSLDLERFDDYRCLVLTEPCEYAPEVFDKLRQWVNDGGTLVAVGDALLCDQRFQLDDVFGLEYIEPSVYSVCHFKPRPEMNAQVDDLQLQCRGASVKVLPTTARVLADAYYPEHECTATFSFRNGDCPPPAATPSGYPFATVNECGQGKAVYIAGSIFKIYWEYNHHWLRQFIEGVFDTINPQPLYKIDIGAQVEANMMQLPDGDRLLNLIHYQVGHPGSSHSIPSIERIHPLTNIACRVRDDGISAIALEPGGEKLEFRRASGYLFFTLPELEHLAVIRLIRACGG
ncbi:MAG: alpha-L-fucosidase [Candidatus Marinimicrobia bacterium]|nr:alpha-L-fucosidase [Candidatus Neomarinimicrobiota bacterium]